MSASTRYEVTYEVIWTDRLTNAICTVPVDGLLVAASLLWSLLPETSPELWRVAGETRTLVDQR